jgi:hypothetical protein
MKTLAIQDMAADGDSQWSMHFSSLSLYTAVSSRQISFRIRDR